MTESSLSAENRGFPRVSTPSRDGVAYKVVIGSPRRIAASDGISVGERDVFAQGVDYLAEKGPLVFISIEWGNGPDAENKVRQFSRKVRSDIALAQKRAKMRGPYYVELLHATDRKGLPKFNSHIIAPMPNAAKRDRLAEAINMSKIYGINGFKMKRGPTFAKRVYDIEKLKGYLLVEMTTQAAFRTGIRRKKGSHPLGELGGDRVRPSPAVKAYLVRTERIDAYTRTNARRRAGKPKALEAPRPLLLVVCNPLVREPVTPDMFNARPICRLADYAGGLMPAAVALEVEFHRKRLGLTQQAVADLSWIARPTLANVCQGRFPLSQWAATRLRELLLGQSFSTAAAESALAA